MNSKNVFEANIDLSHLELLPFGLKIIKTVTIGAIMNSSFGKLMINELMITRLL